MKILRFGEIFPEKMRKYPFSSVVRRNFFRIRVDFYNNLQIYR